MAKIHSARVWEDFLALQDTAIQAIKVFLTSYVRNSLQERIVLDERESVKGRAVTSALSVVMIWRALIAAADFRIMEPKRRDRPKEARSWTLQWLQEVEGRLIGPGFKVVLVSDLFFLYIEMREC